MNTLIRLEGLHKSYAGAMVLRGISLEVAAAQIVAIMGPSGCGKSTLLHILGLLLTPDQGGYEALGQEMFALNHREKARFRRQFFGFILQSCNVFAHTTVAENVEYPLIYAGVPRRERLRRVRNVLAQVHLEANENERSNTLSGGEQQRVAIARALINNPRILFADEPTGQLDRSNTEHLMRIFARWPRRCTWASSSSPMMPRWPRIVMSCTPCGMECWRPGSNDPTIIRIDGWCGFINLFN